MAAGEGAVSSSSLPFPRDSSVTSSWYLSLWGLGDGCNFFTGHKMLLAHAVACSVGLFSTVLVGKSACVEMHPCQRAGAAPQEVPGKYGKKGGWKDGKTGNSQRCFVLVPYTHQISALGLIESAPGAGMSSPLLPCALHPDVGAGFWDHLHAAACECWPGSHTDPHGAAMVRGCPGTWHLIRNFPLSSEHLSYFCE